MKTAMFISEGKKQIVLTPESKYEETLLNEIHTSKVHTTLFTGSFYQCQGGWIRQGTSDSSDKSLMILLENVG